MKYLVSFELTGTEEANFRKVKEAVERNYERAGADIGGPITDESFVRLMLLSGIGYVPASDNGKSQHIQWGMPCPQLGHYCRHTYLPSSSRVCR